MDCGTRCLDSNNNDAPSMLISPIRVHQVLDGLLGATDAEGPHTALLITPQGELLAKATVPDEDDDDEDGDAEGRDEDGGDQEGGDQGGEDRKEPDEDDDGDDDGDEEEDDEPYLEGPERLRLLLGLASQWEEDESPRVECEVSNGRLTSADALSSDDCSCAPSRYRRLRCLLRTPPCLPSGRHACRRSFSC